MKKILLSLSLAILVVQSPISWFSTQKGTISAAFDAVTPDAITESSPSLAPNDPPAVFFPLVSRPPEQEWAMVAANAERTSWTPQQVSGTLRVDWYRPIEAYIPQNVQIIASNNLLFISTAKGLYALSAVNGAVVWRYDTEMPLGNSPTVSNGIVYVGGYDRKLHALSALNGSHLWEFSGAQAGYDTNPLVIDGKVFIGNRDGYMYAIGAHNTPNQGQLLWRFKTGGPIHYSAAYKDGKLYFAADDNYAYALNAQDGTLVWRSEKMPGDGYHSYWPVIYQNYVIFTTAPAYRQGIEPGTRTISDDNGTPYGTMTKIQTDDLFPTEGEGTPIGPTVPDPGWAEGYPVIDGSRIAQYLENNPNPHSNKHKPWRRNMIVLNLSTGNEYTYDWDRDGYPEYIPVAFWGTNTGNQYPPIVGSNNTLYFNNVYMKTSAGGGRVMGWRPDGPYMSVVGGQGAIAEPQAISAGGGLIYRSICCDRVGDWFSMNTSMRGGSAWSYNLAGLAPGYDETWTILPGWPRLNGFYVGNTNSVNGIYHNHGVQNPIIPYKGRLYIHRSNTIIAFGSVSGPGKLPLLRINAAQGDSTQLSELELRARLEEEIQKMLTAGHLRPGYYGVNHFSLYFELADYYNNPGDTIYTLAKAYPYLSLTLQGQVRTYLKMEFNSYFDSEMYADIGWASGAAREWMPLPPEIQANLAEFPARSQGYGFSWNYPPHNFYAMWKYAEIFPEDASLVYDLAKTKLQVPVPQPPSSTWFSERPFEYNAYIAGYIGFLNLQTLAGKTVTDGQLRTQVTNELNRLLSLRARTFNKDTPFGEYFFYKKQLDIARNFMMLVPELGDYLNDNALTLVQTAMSEYEAVAPYWFVSRFDSSLGEGTLSHLYNVNAMFLAKAYILKESRAELTKHLDAPGFERGDLFYIQNIIAALEAP